MKKMILLLLVITFSLEMNAQQLIYSKVKINLLGSHTIEDIAALGLECDHGVYAKGRHLINDFSSAEIRKLEENGVDFEILIEDVSTWYQERSNMDIHAFTLRTDVCSGTAKVSPGSQYAQPSNYQYGSMGGYQTYEELLATLDQMHTLYPDIITAKAAIPDIVTHENRPIYWLTISDNPSADENEPEIFYTALHHAREANSLSQLIFYMWYLLENYETDDNIKALVNNTKMYFIPCVNPDGYIYNQTTNPNGGGMWRKNRYVSPNNQHGVDLNRNYGYEWGLNDTGSSPNPSSDTYRGTAAFSEPETQAIKAFVTGKNIEIALNAHTFSNLLIRPKVDDSTDLKTYQNFGEILVKENHYKFGTDMETVGYEVNGDSDSWMYRDETVKPKIFSMTPEVGPQQYGFWPPQSAILSLNQAMMDQNLIAAQLLLNYMELKDNTPYVLADVSGNLLFDIKQYGLRPTNTTVTVTPLSNNLTINTPVVTTNIPTGASQVVSVPYTITPTASQFIDTVRFVVTVNDGMFNTKDTLTKQHINGVPSNLVLDSGENMSGWTTSSWGTTTATYVSSPSCITDSPDGNHSSNVSNDIELNQEIDLTNAGYATLKYWAKWDLEKNYDYVQILAQEVGASTWTALCGKYTVNLSESENKPLYTGKQEDWVLEEIDIKDYIGKKFRLKFNLTSDTYENEDGFYFDDFRIDTYEEMPSSSYNITQNTPQVQAFPSPFSHQLNVEITLQKTAKFAEISLINTVGQVIKSQKYDTLIAGRHSFTWKTDELPYGVYVIQYQDETGQRVVRKVVR